MNKEERKIRKALPIVLAVGFLVAAVALASAAHRAKNRAVHDVVTLYLETPVSLEDSQKIREMENGIEFTAWGEFSDVTVTDPDLGRSVQADALVLDGSSELVLPLAPILAKGDTKGCLLGEETAWELFGSTKVTGDSICIGDETRLIRGVVNMPQSGVVLGGDVKGLSETGLCYNRITVGSKKTEAAETFLMKTGLDGKILRFDELHSLHWLTELIPGKWSDFPGWKINITQKKQEFELLLEVEKNSVELYYVKQCFLYVRNTVLKAVCVLGVFVCLFPFMKFPALFFRFRPS